MEEQVRVEDPTTAPARLVIEVIELAARPGGGNQRGDRIDEKLNIQRLGFSSWRGHRGHYIPSGHSPNSLKSRLRSPCQHLGKWRNIGTKPQWRRAAFSGKALLYMEIDALAARTPKCSMRNLEHGSGAVIASERISAALLSGIPEGHQTHHQPGTFVTLHGSRDRLRTTGRSRATKLYLDPRPPLPRKPKPELQKRRNTMDDYKNPASDTPYGQPEGGSATAARMKLSEKAAEVKEKVADFGRKTVDNIDESRKSTADALHQAAAKLHLGGEQLSGAAHTAADQISGVAHGTADKLRSAADYIRETDLKGMGEDVKEVVKRYPGPALAAAAVLGFIVARAFRRD